MKNSKAKKNLEICKREYLKALEHFESCEEERLAALHEPKVNLQNIIQWSAYMQGARQALLWMLEHEDEFAGKVYKQAALKLITSELRYVGMFLTQQNQICFRNHKRDKKGKLVSVEVYFAEAVTIYREI